ncbi:MAG: flavodoxin domain-containing protein [Bacteroidetes bacterium]|nr:flavodoxin domain-containing protein [Bacteroidota bacterium]MCL5026877.1 flavodoxin domain-containing protein [Chloroflexota bacterium]
MNTLVVYDSQFGNTERIAQAIADALSEFGQARAVHLGQTRPAELREVDLLVLGSPIQGWKPTPAMQAFLERIPSGSLSSTKTACFDTRLRWPRLLRGSAADEIARQLRKKGTEPIVPPEGFSVKGKEGPLHAGEVERAANWARLLHEKYEASQPRFAAR